MRLVVGRIAHVFPQSPAHVRERAAGVAPRARPRRRVLPSFRVAALRGVAPSFRIVVRRHIRRDFFKRAGRTRLIKRRPLQSIVGIAGFPSLRGHVLFIFPDSQCALAAFAQSQTKLHCERGLAALAPHICVCPLYHFSEYVLENRKWNETFAAQFDKAIDLLRCWSTGVDAAYDKQLICAPRDVARLSLVSLDAFKRLELLQLTWLRQGKDGDNYAPRLTFRTNLETLRSTLRRTMTARNSGGGVGGGASSGIATPTTS